ncbi:TPA: hypothetical protein N0F65_004802, partial [Lagenidium giganteum]
RDQDGCDCGDSFHDLVDDHGHGLDYELAPCRDGGIIRSGRSARWAHKRSVHVNEMERSSVSDRPFRIVDPFHIQRDETTHIKPTYISNQIRTSKYTWVNFLPLCLWQEFRRPTNMYFLAIAILQSMPSNISPISPITAVAPLIAVVGVSLIREAVQDQAKRQSDRLINQKPVVVVRNFEQQTVMWESIEVGDIVRVYERELIPADGVILSSSEENGSCFIDTSNLDGEANLKTREALRSTLNLAFEKEDRNKQQYFIRCEQPDQDLYRFSGNISIDAKLYSLSEKQFLLRGSTLMNTKWANLLVVYTGHESKIMKNARHQHHKLSHVENLTSRIVILIFILQVVLCAVATILHRIEKSHLKDATWYLDTASDTPALQLLYIFLTFVVLLNTLIPISLVLTIEFIKTVHAKFISWDDQMRNSRGEGALANTTSLTDELGQVKYIFTDKTGTLTQNQMVFRRCSVDGYVYGMVDRKDPPRAVSISSLDVVPREVGAPANNQSGRMDSPLPPAPGPVGEMRSLACFRGFLRNLETTESRLALAMAICHTVVCESDSATGDVRYNSDSPDECALVRGAGIMGVKLLGRNGQHMFLSLTEEGREKSYLKTVTYTLTYEVLRVLHFTSDRKRMSIIVRDAEGRLKLICKGADSVILDRCEEFLSPKAVTMDHVTQFAGEGYRILLFAERILENSYYESWEARFLEAELDIHAKDAKCDMLIEEIERKMLLVGASAVEDKLQEGVPETISLLHKAGLKIWVLTGDKLETSLEMGKLCRVVTPGMKEVILRASTKEEMAKKLETALRDSEQENQTQALVIEGSSLTCALMPTNRNMFLRLALRSSTVIVCRTSPLQKALVVELVKSGVPHVTLAVGDGANDVSMIRAAHVGIGVTGQEGMQAVRSADYAIQQFSHLGRLLLFHGRLSYIRIAQCVNHFFYKNVVFTLPQFIYGVVSLFAGRTFFDGTYISCYNVVFTVLPVFIRAVLETDLPERVAETFPELYRAGSMDEYLSIGTVLRSTLWATLHAIVLTLISIFIAQQPASVNTNGITGDFQSSSVTAMWYIVPVVHIQLCCETWNWTSFTRIFYGFSLLFFLLGSIVMDFVNITTEDYQGVWRNVISMPIFWLGFLLSVVSCILPFMAVSCYEENFVTTNPVHILRRVRFFNKILDASQVEKMRDPEPTVCVPPAWYRVPLPLAPPFPRSKSAAATPKASTARRKNRRTASDCVWAGRDLIHSVTMFNKLSSVVTKAVSETVQGVLGEEFSKHYETPRDCTASGGHELSWKIFPGVSRKNNAEVSIFVFDKDELAKKVKKKEHQERVLDVLRQEMRTLRLLRHPHVLKVEEIYEESRRTLSFVTERVTCSLANACKNFTNVTNVTPEVLEIGLTEFEVACGLMHIGEALSFLHREGRRVHMSLGPHSVFITPKGEWKLGGMGFCRVVEPGHTSRSEYYGTDTSTGVKNPTTGMWEGSWEPPLEYCAPELVTEPRLFNSSADMFSLGLLVFELFVPPRADGGRNPVLDVRDGNKMTHGYKISTLHPITFPPQVPVALHNTIRALLSVQPTQRPEARTFLASQFFDSGPIKTLRTLQSLVEQDPASQARFLQALPDAIDGFSVRVLRDMVIPGLQAAVINKQVAPFAITPLLKIVGKVDKHTFSYSIAPMMIPLLAITEPVQCMLMFVSALETLIPKAEDGYIRDHIVPMLCRALDSTVPEILDTVLNKIVDQASLFEYRILKQTILPRVNRLILQPPQMSVRVNALLWLAKSFHVFDKDLLVESVLPTLAQTLQTDKTPAVCMCILGCYDNLGKHLGPEFIATLIIPAVAPLLWEKSLNSQQFDCVCEKIQDMLKAVIQDRDKVFAAENSVNSVATGATVAAGFTEAVKAAEASKERETYVSAANKMLSEEFVPPKKEEPKSSSGDARPEPYSDDPFHLGSRRTQTTSQIERRSGGETASERAESFSSRRRAKKGGRSRRAGEKDAEGDLLDLPSGSSPTKTSSVSSDLSGLMAALPAAPASTSSGGDLFSGMNMSGATPPAGAAGGFTQNQNARTMSFPAGGMGGNNMGGGNMGGMGGVGYGNQQGGMVPYGQNLAMGNSAMQNPGMMQMQPYGLQGQQQQQQQGGYGGYNQGMNNMGNMNMGMGMGGMGNNNNNGMGGPGQMLQLQAGQDQFQQMNNGGDKFSAFDNL